MSPEMNETLIAQASLDKLHDIHVPDPIGYFPLAPGWWFVLFLLLTLALHFLWQYYLQYKHNQYRREALQVFKELSANNTAQPLALLQLAKRTAITAYSREEIATLSDDAWWDFMQRESQVAIEKTLRKALSAFLYDDRDLTQKEYSTLLRVVERWIVTHKGRLDD